MIDKIYFCGGSLGGVYHIGAIKALYENEIYAKTIYGTSAGTFYSLMYLLKIPVKKIKLFYKNSIENYKQNVLKTPLKFSSYQLTKHSFSIIREINSNYPDAYNKCNGRLHIGFVKYNNGGFTWKSEFQSNEDLFNTMLCSCNIPFICNYKAHNNEDVCIDGCMGRQEHFHLPKDVFSIGVVNNKCCINANISTILCFLPLSSDFYSSLISRGYSDTCMYIKYKTKFTCVNTLPCIHDLTGIIPIIHFLYKIQEQFCSDMYSINDILEDKL